mgnify:CR=1 FL=1
MLEKKKGNVDADIIFSIMKRLYLKERFNKVVLVSGDGDYKMLVDFLIEQNKFEKILFPNREFASSLYKKLGSEYFDYLENVKDKIEVKRKGLLRQLTVRIPFRLNTYMLANLNLKVKSLSN